MSEDSEKDILDSMGREVYNFSSAVEQLTQRWPSQHTLIMQQVHRYIETIQQMARNLHHTGSILHSQQFNDERHMDFESQPRNDVPSMHDNDFCFVNDLGDGDPNDDYGGRSAQGDQDLISSVPLDQEDSARSRAVDSEHLQETSRYSSSFQDATSADEQHIGLMATINPAAISLHAINNCRPIVDGDGVTRSIPALSALLNQAEFETQTVVATLHRKNLESHTSATRKASCQRQQKLISLQQPWSEDELTNSMSEDLRKIDKVRIRKIELLYNSIGSANSLLQLKRILSTIRAPQIWNLKCSETNGKKIFQSLEDLDATTHAYGLRRRILLLRLVEYRDRRYQELRQDRPISRKRLHGGSECTSHRKVPSEVLDTLVEEICPARFNEDPKHLESDRKKIKNRLCIARHWQRAMKYMGLGIFALIPTGGPSDIHNTTFETLQNRECRVLLELLKGKNGGYVQTASKKLTPLVKAMYDGNDFSIRLRLEDVEEASLHNIDPSRFVWLCDQTSDNGRGSTESFSTPT